MSIQWVVHLAALAPGLHKPDNAPGWSPDPQTDFAPDACHHACSGPVLGKRHLEVIDLFDRIAALAVKLDVQFGATAHNLALQQDDVTTHGLENVGHAFSLIGVGAI
eukprot:CAMPEP_0115341126 /NCGR_PEP_ID=MMETSP0270-20121206/91514_1 /TAXON_ID=71861 /ORGANISM="Scrippsiella trochoidea, Strain CCMP3099" /LENGTH=106 /DNA_ID=CAMNT_0002762627 /DNA_START=142 /DNA_END=463 /DNA_ORIENTATION=+